jgi:uncharacterized membrane protein YbhN (UPF0104 family)
MPSLSLKWLSGHLLGRRASTFATVLGLAAILDAVGTGGMSYVAGFHSVWHLLIHLSWPWLAALVGGMVCSFAGYYVAYRGVYEIAGGAHASRRQLAAVVIAGFGGLLSHAGSGLDHYALEAMGNEKRDARVRGLLLTGLEQGALAIIGSVAGIAVLVQDLDKPTPDFSIPWAVIPAPGFVIAFWVGERYADRFGQGMRRWRDKLGMFLEAINLSRELFTRPYHQGPAVFGMTLFWLADAFGVYAVLEACGYDMNVAALFVGYATGMVFTRRTVPLGGAGILVVVLAVTIWYSGAPISAAVIASAFYRLGAFWLAVPFSLAALPTLHKLGQQPAPVL